MDSAYAKLARACHHLDELTRSVHDYRARDPHQFTREFTNHLLRPDHVVAKLRVTVSEPIPTEWPLIIGDLLTNLRAALDHALYGHVTAAHTLSPTAERSLQYPILTNHEKWPTVSTKLAAWCDPRVLGAIEATQPFKSTAPDEHPLAVMNGLVNSDKHRSIRVVTYNRHEVTVTNCPLTVVSIDDKPKEMADGAVIATITLERPKSSPGGKPRQHLVPFDTEVGYVEEVFLPVPGRQGMSGGSSRGWSVRLVGSWWPRR
ncbi:hypothetical protein [Nocardia africana]|uniref:Uncharacterized protein n=1 Tax=Nocardia africana TaxID=134964 RepID=A0A378X730_9NOCA|nr:hypothetical protein [Nocardia africana]MCC3317817.1 hypothetical protein [Nocardia africana]SUA48585.1 Uncharacterised protein [Nocardia africana]